MYSGYSYGYDTSGTTSGYGMVQPTTGATYNYDATAATSTQQQYAAAYNYGGVATTSTYDLNSAYSNAYGTTTPGYGAPTTTTASTSSPYGPYGTVTTPEYPTTYDANSGYQYAGYANQQAIDAQWGQTASGMESYAEQEVEDVNTSSWRDYQNTKKSDNVRGRARGGLIKSKVLAQVKAHNASQPAPAYKVIKPPGTERMDYQQQAEDDDDDEDIEPGKEYYCQICDVDCKTLNAYVNHTRGMIHTQKAMGVDTAGQPMDTGGAGNTTTPAMYTNVTTAIPKPKNVPDYPDTSMYTTFLKMPKEGEEDDGVDMSVGPQEKKGEHGELVITSAMPGATSYYCEVCQCSMSGPKAFEAHISGTRHKKNIEHRAKGNPISKGRSKSKAAETLLGAKVNPGRALVMSSLEKVTEPLIGLQYITELQKPGNVIEPRYICDLCDSMSDGRTIVSHVTGHKHRLNYLAEHFMNYYSYVKQKGPKKADQAPIIEEYSRAVEADEGRMEVKVKKDTEGFAGVIKAPAVEIPPKPQQQQGQGKRKKNKDQGNGKRGRGNDNYFSYGGDGSFGGRMDGMMGRGPRDMMGIDDDEDTDFALDDNFMGNQRGRNRGGRGGFGRQFNDGGGFGGPFQDDNFRGGGRGGRGRGYGNNNWQDDGGLLGMGGGGMPGIKSGGDGTSYEENWGATFKIKKKKRDDDDIELVEEEGGVNFENMGLPASFGSSNERWKEYCPVDSDEEDEGNNRGRGRGRGGRGNNRGGRGGGNFGNRGGGNFGNDRGGRGRNFGGGRAGQDGSFGGDGFRGGFGNNRGGRGGFSNNWGFDGEDNGMSDRFNGDQGGFGGDGFGPRGRGFGGRGNNRGGYRGGFDEDDGGLMGLGGGFGRGGGGFNRGRGGFDRGGLEGGFGRGSRGGRGGGPRNFGGDFGGDEDFGVDNFGGDNFGNRGRGGFGGGRGMNRGGRGGGMDSGNRGNRGQGRGRGRGGRGGSSDLDDVKVSTSSGGANTGIGKFLKEMSGCLVESEDDAAMALEMSNQLTKALLKYRINQDDGEEDSTQPNPTDGEKPATKQ